MDAVTARPRPLLARLPYLHLGLLAATLVTTMTFGGLMHVPGDVSDWRTIALGGLPFATALIAILLCHEMGHYLMARAYDVDSTLPFFIPVPFGVGTFGAVIKIRSAMPSRQAVFDIGAAGPFAGFAVALPLYVWGLAQSRVHALGDLALDVSNTGSPLAMLRAWLAGEPLRAGEGPVQIMGDSLVTWAAGRLVHGDLPANADVLLHPVAFAAWIGLFITTLNLIPIGQLDGGHVTYALLGRRRALAFSRLVSWGLLACGLLLSWNWLLWFVVARVFVGPRHPPALAEEPLDPGRRLLAYAALALFAVTFIPVPVSF